MASSKWVRDIFVIPVLVGVLIAVFTTVFPKIFERGKRLTYTVEGPSTALSSQLTPNLALSINGQPVSRLFTYQVRIWNSGGEPLKSVPVRLQFSPSGVMKIYAVSHTTQPPEEFGRIDEVGSTNSAKRFVFELLNPGDSDVITLLLDQPAPLVVHSKIEGLKLNKQSTTDTRRVEFWLGLAGVVLALVASLLSLGLKYLSEMSIWPFR